MSLHANESTSPSPRRRRIAMLLYVAPIGVLLACASPGALDAPDVSPGERDAAIGKVGSKMLRSRLDERRRLLDIEYRLTRAAAPRCGAMSRPHAGILLATPESFDDAKLQALASDVLTISEGPTIVYAVPGGSFERGGLREGDRLITLDGQPVKSSSDVVTLLISSGTRSSVLVKAQRVDAPDLEVDVPLDLTCPIRLGLATSALIIPWQTQRLLLSIPLGLARSVDDDSTLAVVVAHQMAHTLYDKPDDDALTSEQRADRIGLGMAAAAGYDVGGAVGYWEQVAAEYPSLIGDAPPDWRPLAWKQSQWTSRSHMPHPEIARRLGAIREMVRSISEPQQHDESHRR